MTKKQVSTRLHVLHKHVSCQVLAELTGLYHDRSIQDPDLVKGVLSLRGGKGWKQFSTVRELHRWEREKCLIHELSAGHHQALFQSCHDEC